MDEPTPQGGKFWALIGKASIGVALIVGLITIWDKYTTPGAKLEAVASWGPYLLEPGFNDFIKEISDTTSQENLKKLFNTEVSRLSGQKINDTSAEWLSREIQSALDKAKRDTITDPGGYWKIRITNPGELIIKGATLRIPEAGIAKVMVNNNAKIDRELPEIEVGNIPPGGSVDVYAWSSSSYATSSDYENVTLYHSGGRATVKFPEEKGFFSALLSDPFLFFIVLLGSIFVFLLVYVFGYSAGDEAAKKKAAQSEVKE